MISKDIIIPQNLTLKIQAGSLIKFEPGISLISYSPILAVGTSSAPITFTSNSEQKWGVVGILNTEEKTSVFENSFFENGSDANINGVYFSGQLSSYHSKIEVRNSTFRYAGADDSLNIKNSESLVESCIFRDNPYDALDLDFSEASKVLNSTFENNGNDGLDISGGGPLVIGNIILNSRDKGISLGEATQATLVNNLVKNSVIGIAVKDSSQVVLVNNTVINNETGLSLYQKKPIFKGGEAQVINSIFWGNKQLIDADNLSKVSFTFSNVEGGFNGENNRGEDPELNEKFQTTNQTLKANPEFLKEHCMDCKIPEKLLMGIY